MPTAAVLAGIVSPTAKVSQLGSTATTVALASLPAVVIVVGGGVELGVAMVLLVLGTGASVAWAVDDPAEDLLASTPVSAPVRAAVRILAAAIVAGMVTAATLGFVAAGPGLPTDLGDRVSEGAAAAAVGLAVAFSAARRGDRTAGATGAVSGILLPAVVAGLALRWPTWFPSFGAGDLHARWWLVVAAGLLVVARSGRDPFRR
jgi:hypothetical protein